MKSEIAAPSFLRTIEFYTAPIPGVDVRGRDYDYAVKPILEHLAPILGDSYYIDPLGVTPI